MALGLRDQRAFLDAVGEAEWFQALVTDCCRIVATGNHAILWAKWHLGRRILNDPELQAEMGRSERAYGRKVIEKLAQAIQEETGSPCSRTDLYNCIQFARQVGEDELSDGIGQLRSWDHVVHHVLPEPRQPEEDPGAQIDKAHELQRKWATATGQVWVIPSRAARGSTHRLMCGDSTRADDVARLMGGQVAAMAFTDPPYNVAYGGGPEKVRKAMANDCLAPQEWEVFCRRWAGLLLEHVDGAIYLCMSSGQWPTVCRVLAELGAHWSDTIIWAKDHFVLGWADYQHQYEPVWYGWREGTPHYWCGDRDQGDVWIIPRPRESALHPTMKPLALMERAIRNSSEPGDLVLDLFVGSGSTLVAAERTGRLCYGMEVDPGYVAVSLQRMADMGLEPRLEGPST